MSELTPPLTGANFDKCAKMLSALKAEQARLVRVAAETDGSVAGDLTRKAAEALDDYLQTATPTSLIAFYDALRADAEPPTPTDECDSYAEHRMDASDNGH